MKAWVLMSWVIFSLCHLQGLELGVPMSIKASSPTAYGQTSLKFLVILYDPSGRHCFLPLKVNTSLIKKCFFSLSCLLKYVSFTWLFFIQDYLLAMKCINMIPQSTSTSILGQAQMICVHSPGCSSVLSGELRCKLLIHINILVFPLELASWLDAIKIKSTNAAHTSAGSHLLYHRETG